eukprot:PhM_4_TR18028/c2_g3_i3/m.32365
MSDSSSPMVELMPKYISVGFDHDELAVVRDKLHKQFGDSEFACDVATSPNPDPEIRWVTHCRAKVPVSSKLIISLPDGSLLEDKLTLFGIRFRDTEQQGAPEGAEARAAVGPLSVAQTLCTSGVHGGSSGVPDIHTASASQSPPALPASPASDLPGLGSVPATTATQSAPAPQSTSMAQHPVATDPSMSDLLRMLVESNLHSQRASEQAQKAQQDAARQAQLTQEALLKTQQSFMAAQAERSSAQETKMTQFCESITAMCATVQQGQESVLREEKRAVKGHFDTHEESLEVYGCWIDQAVRKLYPRIVIPYDIKIMGQHNPGTARELLASYAMLVHDAETTLTDLYQDPIPRLLEERLGLSPSGRTLVRLSLLGEDLRGTSVGCKLAFLVELDRLDRKATREAINALMLRPQEQPFECSAALEKALKGDYLRTERSKRLVLSYFSDARSAVQPPTPPVSTTPKHDSKKEGKKPVEKVYFKKKFVPTSPSLKSPVPSSSVDSPKKYT